MAKSPESMTIDAELFLRYPSGKETKLGDVQIEQHVRYEFSFERARVQDAPATVRESLGRITDSDEPTEDMGQ